MTTYFKGEKNYMRKFSIRQLKEMWLDFYESKGHAVIKSASVIPDNDPSVLFTTAGMHPLVPYLLGEKHPLGKRLANVQKCIRTGDIDEVGNPYHLTFFEMMGNWSLGDYFKKEKIAWSYEFLTSDKYLNLLPHQFAVTVFEGDENAPRDEESAACWEEQGVSKDRIFFLNKAENWWEIERGPCGPDSEIFLDTQKEKCSKDCNPSCSCGKYVEIGNDVYMQYEKIGDNEYISAKQKNVDTGFGLERNMVVLNGAKSVYATEVFSEAIQKLEELSGKKYTDDEDGFTKSFRIVCDHIRCASVILGEENGIVPSNKDAGYVLRRLIRKAVRHAKKLGVESGKLVEISSVFINQLGEYYPELLSHRETILSELLKEEERFEKTLETGLKEWEKVVLNIMKKNEFMKKSNPNHIDDITISGKTVFRLYETFGFPLEITMDLAKEQGLIVDVEGYNKSYEEHQELARSSSAGHFKGGLAGTGYEFAKYHTATHILLSVLRKHFGDNVFQKGSNITADRLRFDFSFERKLTKEEIAFVEKDVNDVIAKGIDVVAEEMSLESAKNCGAMGVFEEKYGDVVTVYSIPGVSKEICGGPHAKNTKDLGVFSIVKEESSSFGVRRIKAVLK